MKHVFAKLSFIFFALLSPAYGQVLVDAKNVNDDKAIQYIQFLYYIDKAEFKPVYMIDFGIVDPASTDMKKQKLTINGIEIKPTMSPMLVLNKLHQAGWEYLGDETYVHVPMMEGWYSFTLRRNPNTKSIP